MKSFFQKNLLLFILLMAVFFNQILWISAIPYNFAPDEYAHLDVVERFVTTGKYPQFLENPPNGILVKENQVSVSYTALPPIPYLIDSYILIIFNQHVNQNYLYLFTRLGSALALIITIISIFYLILLLTQKKYLSLIGGILAGFIPQMSFLGAYINNDIWAIAGSSMSIYLSTKIFLDKNITKPLLIITGLIFGFTLLTLWNTIPILGLCLLIIFFKLSKSTQPVTKFALLIFALIISSSWWFIKNWLLYQDFTLINKFYEIAKITRPQEFRNIGIGKLLFNTSWLEVTLKSAYGVFDWNYIYLPQYFYVIFAGFVIIALILILINRKKFSQSQMILMLFYTLCIICIFTITAIQSAYRFFQPQGRYLLPVVSGFVVLLVLGLKQFWKGLLLKITALFLLFTNIYSITAVIIPRYYGLDKVELALYRQAFWEMIFAKPFPFDKWGLIVIIVGFVFFCGLTVFQILKKKGSLN